MCFTSQPDLSRTVREPELNVLGQDNDKCKYIEDFIVDTRMKSEEVLKKHVGVNGSRQLLAMFIEAVLRLALSRTKTKHFATTAVGKYSIDKLSQLRSDWMVFIQSKYASMSDFAYSVGLPLAIVESAASAADADLVGRSTN